MKITEEEVLTILNLVEKSNFGELHLQVGDLNLTLIKGGADSTVQEQSALLTKVKSKVINEELNLKTEQIIEKGEGALDASTENKCVFEVEGLSIKAPLIGTFYQRPEPGAAPFVEPGTFVEEDTTVCLIETMKVFNSVKAGSRGYIEAVCVEDAQMVEYGQVLFKVCPD